MVVSRIIRGGEYHPKRCASPLKATQLIGMEKWGSGKCPVLEKRTAMKRNKSAPTEPALKGKPVSASASEMAEVVLPAQTNALGKLLGGHVMHLVDIAAAIAASRHANSYMVQIGRAH